MTDIEKKVNEAVERAMNYLVTNKNISTLGMLFAMKFPEKSECEQLCPSVGLPEPKEEQLLPCPFCGDRRLITNGHKVECEICGASGPTIYPVPDHIKTQELWNRRPAVKDEGIVKVYNKHSFCGTSRKLNNSDTFVEDAWKAIVAYVKSTGGVR